MLLVAVGAVWLFIGAVCLLVVAGASFATCFVPACYPDVVKPTALVTLQRPWRCRLHGGAHIGQVDVLWECASREGEKEGAAASVGLHDLSRCAYVWDQLGSSPGDIYPSDHTCGLGGFFGGNLRDQVTGLVDPNVLNSLKVFRGGAD